MAAAVSMDEQPQARLANAEDTMRCSSQRPSCTSSPRTPRATRSSLRSTRTSNPRARPPSNNEHAPLRKNEYHRESRKFHRRQALQQRQGAGLNTSKRKRQGARTARQATAVPPPVAPARGPRSPRRAARTPCQRYRRRKIRSKKLINCFLRFISTSFPNFYLVSLLFLRRAFESTLDEPQLTDPHIQTITSRDN